VPRDRRCFLNQRLERIRRLEHHVDRLPRGRLARVAQGRDDFLESVRQRIDLHQADHARRPLQRMRLPQQLVVRFGAGGLALQPHEALLDAGEPLPCLNHKGLQESLKFKTFGHVPVL
jgi:hypothetical protein